MLVTNRKELTTSLVHADNFGPKNHRNYAFSSYLHVLSSSLLIDLSCSRLPDSWYPGKGGGGGKKEKAALPPPSFLPFYFRFRAFSISRTQPSWSLEQANLGADLDSRLLISRMLLIRLFTKFTSCKH